MGSSHVDSAILAAALAKSAKCMDDIEAALTPMLVVMSDEQREERLRPPLRYDAAAIKLIDAAVARPNLCAAAEFDPSTVRDDLANAAAVLALTARAQELVQRLTDSRLQWRADAYEPSLTLYQMAKIRAEKDGQLRLILQPMEEVFAVNKEGGNKRKKKAPSDDAPSEDPDTTG